MASTRLALSFALLAAGIACGPAVSPAEPAASETESAGPAPASPTAESSAQTGGATAEASDPAADCFNGFREPIQDCVGLDLTGLVVASAGGAPEFASGPLMEGRLAFVVTFADDLAQVEEFGICFHMNLDGDDGTGYDDIDMPGLERVICAFPPDGAPAWYERGALGYDADPIRDEAILASFMEGSQLVVAVDPSLLVDSPGAAADGFVLYVGTARSINSLDYFNGQGPLHVPEAVVVTDEVVAQVR